MSQNSLNKAQKQAVEYIDGPLLIVAGAGTGKTSVITEKIRYLIEEKKVHPGNILALTFTEKAAKEMQERVESLMDFGFYDTHISTFHAFCQEILEEYGLHIGLPNKFKLMTDTDAWLLMREHIYDFDLEYYRPLGNPTRHIHELLKHFSKCKDELITPKQYLEYAEGLKLDGDDVETEEKNKYIEIANAYHTYNQLLLDKGALDFGDLIFYTIKLIQERPSIKKKLQERFKYILVDEFQDVNWAQYRLTQVLSSESQLTVVGDDDQSIYAFRGASVSNILRFQEDFKNAKNIVLNENYRSGQEILDIAYTSVQNNNPDRLEVKLNIDKKLQAKTKGLKASVHQNIVATIDDEVKFVVEKILELKQSNPEIVWDDFAILVRANNHAEPFLRGLQSAGIPYEFLAAVGLFKQSIVMDALNFFKVLDYHHDSPAMYRVLRMPCLNFSEEDMQKVTSNAKRKTVSYYEILKRAAEFQLSEGGIEIANKILGLIDECVQKARTEKPSKVLHHFFEGSGCSKYLIQKESEGDSTVIHDVYQLQQFFEFLARFEESTPDAHLKGFLEQYTYILESGDEGKLYQPTDTPDSVNIMTIHGSKGLEFKYVFIVNMVEDRFPSRRRSDPIELPVDLINEKLPEGDYHIEEERRLFYVAMTRAKEGLYFTSSKSYGGVREKKLSRFLVELGFTDAKSVDTKNTSSESKKDFEQSAFDIVQALSPVKHQNFTRSKYQLPKTYSFSQIQTYEACPYKYKLAHIIKIPTKSTASFSFGTSMHSTLQRFYEKVQELNAVKQANLFDFLEQTPEVQTTSNEVKVPTLEELFTLYEENFIRDWYKDKNQKEDYYKKGKEILRTFYKANEKNWQVPTKLESSFKIQIAGHTLKGRIDRIDTLIDNTLEIIDYKTGQSKEKLTAEDKQQLLIYQIVAQTVPLYKNLGQVSKLTFYYLNDDTKISFVGTEKDLEKLREKIQTSIGNIQAENFVATPSAPICAHCDFRDICEYRML
jgi:DNA helicase-2/ATP-dependent DNA helicase PcrA